MFPDAEHDLLAIAKFVVLHCIVLSVCFFKNFACLVSHVAIGI